MVFYPVRKNGVNSGRTTLPPKIYGNSSNSGWTAGIGIEWAFAGPWRRVLSMTSLA